MLCKVEGPVGLEQPFLGLGEAQSRAQGGRCRERLARPGSVISAFPNPSLHCAPQELALKSLSCASRTVGVDFLLSAEPMDLRSLMHLLC